MYIGKWYENTRFNNDIIKGAVKLLPEIAEIELSGNGYKMSYMSCDICEFTPDMYIDLTIELSDVKNKKSFYASWFKGETEIFKEYIGNDFRLRPYTDADKLVVSFLVFGEVKETVRVSEIKVKQTEKIKERKVKVAYIVAGSATAAALISLITCLVALL